MGKILVPITNEGDVRALLAAQDPQNCPQHDSLMTYHVGLDLYPYDDQVAKVFSNQVLWDDKLHAPLYIDFTKAYYEQWKNYSKCPRVFLDLSASHGDKPLAILPAINVCSHKRRYVCLKPKASEPCASALVGGGSFQTSAVVALSALSVFVAFGLIALVVKSKRSVKNNREGSVSDGCENIV